MRFEGRNDSVLVLYFLKGFWQSHAGMDSVSSNTALLSSTQVRLTISILLINHSLRPTAIPLAVKYTEVVAVPMDLASRVSFTTPQKWWLMLWKE